MAQPELLRLIPDAPLKLCQILDSARGSLEPPIRSEIFGPQRFAEHGRSLGETHRAAKAQSHATTFFPRLRNNISVLREAHQYIGFQANTGYDISPAAEWLLDNFHLIEIQLKEIHDGLPRSYFRGLPVLVDEPLAGLPRVYGVAWAFVAHTDSAFDEDLLIQFLSAYQETREFNLSEMWALPTTLRVVLIENLRRLAERVATNKAARELSNLCCDRIESYSLHTLDEILALLNQRGVRRVFLAQMAQRLQDRRTSGEVAYREWLINALPDLAAIRMQQSADQAADNLSVSNAIASLRAIGDTDWTSVISHTSALFRLMLTSPLFEAEHDSTRDQTLHAIEALAKRCGRSELLVAKTLLNLMHGTEVDLAPASDARYWLSGTGRPLLTEALELREKFGLVWHAYLKRLALPAYLLTLIVATLGLVAWVFLRHSQVQISTDLPLWLTLIVALLMAFPASEAVLAVINRLISESAKPVCLPRLALASGIPPEHRVIVVIPAMLTSIASIEGLAHRLHLHYLANPEQYAQFALLTDWADASTEHVALDTPLLNSATQLVQELNTLYPQGLGEAPRFIVLHRVRTFSETEQQWIGWERKRGKLEQLITALAKGTSAAFMNLGNASLLSKDIKYIVTLDSDTQLPPGRLRSLVGVAAHPHNQPKLDSNQHTVESGYSILQPRIATPLPARKDFTLFHWLFAGQCGIDPYSAASSEVYQDIFGEGTFTGKGLLNVQAMHAVLAGRLPEDRVLSHDLLEGSLARCAVVTDITVIEDAPFHADVATSRVHRWTRGDWQLLPFLLMPKRYHLRTINRWKMLDNLRRSLLTPMCLALLLLALGSNVISPWAALTLVLAAFTAGPLMGAVAGFSPTRDDIAKLHFYRHATTELVRALLGGLWHLSQLLQQALMSMDAILRAIYRMTISRRHLLQWTTAEAAQASVKTDLVLIAKQHLKTIGIALALTALFITSAASPLMAIALCLLWAASPVGIWYVSRPRSSSKGAELPQKDQTYLHEIARDTWRLFERCVGAEDNYLPPDNLQTTPYDMVAHRTSPTNIGLYLLSIACARKFGWIGTQDLLTRMEATTATLSTLQLHRGHFLNWYDTQTLAPLQPMYVSTVDSGNLTGHLLAVAQACLELAHEPQDLSETRRAISASRLRIESHLIELPAQLQNSASLTQLLAMPDALIECDSNSNEFVYLLNIADHELTTLLQSNPSIDSPAIWLLADHLATLRSMHLDFSAISKEGTTQTSGTTLRLQVLSKKCEQLAWQADFNFLYHRKRHLLHIGYRVSEQQLDSSFYDLLASESRLTSLLAIAKGDVPVRHWAALGRPFYALGSRAGLRSWSGSMFEYLMPSLVLDEPHGSALYDACYVALREQIDYAHDQLVPWGISECAYATSDHTLAYQYAPQGVPRSALRRTPPEELVIAPYATALAAQIEPHKAIVNFTQMEPLSTRARYGFIESLDFTAGRQSTPERFTRVDTFMAHHQGMSIVAIANVLLNCAPRRWGMANPHIEAVNSLLHERAPHEVSILNAPPSSSPLLAMQKRAPGLIREVLPGSTALEPTHILSNGRYSVSLRANGAGWSRWGQKGITRWRDDALRDAYGSFFFMRRNQHEHPVSITQHPAPDPMANYHSIYHADRVCFDAVWPDLQAHTTVWVSPEDDIEFRKIELRNLSDETLDIELMSAFEVTLTDPRADETHPAFSNLFVHAEWLTKDQVLIFERKPRLPNETALQLAHFLTDIDSPLESVRCLTDRQRWRGRNHVVSQPLACFDAGMQDTSEHNTIDNSTQDTGLDPACALAIHIRIAPHAKAQLTFATAVSDNGSTLRAVIDKYRQPSHVQRASLMSATLTGIRLHAMRISPENFAATQILTSSLVSSLTRLPSKNLNTDNISTEVCDKRLLWHFGISGDRPIILVSAGVPQGIGLLRSLDQGLRIWAWGGITCDLVVINSEPASYQMALHREINALRERYVADSSAQPTQLVPSFYVLRSEDLSSDEMSTLKILARVRLNADGRPLVHHVQEWCDLHEKAFENRHGTSTSEVPVISATHLNIATPKGEFVPGLGEFRFDVNSTLRPTRPWINVLSNPGFGAQISESGGGYTWAVNSRLNQLTAWSNDPIADTPAEWFLLQDLKTQQLWSIAPSAWGDSCITYHVSHGQGYSVISHRRGDLEVTATWCVDTATSVKQVRLKLSNYGHKALSIRVIGIAEWMMGASLTDRSTVQTSLYRQRLPELKEVSLKHKAEREQKLTALLCTQLERSAGFGEGTAFLALATSASESEDWTCDRRECFDARGRLIVPDYFGQGSGTGLDPCAALATRFELAAGSAVEKVFLMGYAENASAAQQLATQAAVIPAVQRLGQVRNTWDTLLGATTVKTPDPLFDAMVNRWLLYQTVSCRLWAKAGFYQAGGATGFRDQLQDAMALAWAAPDMLRAQIILCASRQFIEGDVQHWWHSPSGAGVRTHFSDDLLWLPHACAHYLRVTGDATLLDQSVAFIEGAEIDKGAEDAYYTPGVSSQVASVYEHAARAIDHSLRVGAHGLPLMGSGDWNDGMNRVGHEGRGESVWLGWFLCQLVDDFAPLARKRADDMRALSWEAAAKAWKAALQSEAWDGQWFRRAFFDNGLPLGSTTNAEARIDLIAQAWAALSKAAPPAYQRMALEAVEAHLVDHEAGLIKLLDPPLVHAQPSAGYIQAYPPGIRENGGQYSHAGAWALMAQAAYAQSNPNSQGAGDTAYRYFTYLSSAHRAQHPTHGAAYGIEPYVMAGDVYTQPPYVGRGGWSWYTGAAAWMHRAAIESIFGLQIRAHELCFTPCLPSHWPQAELTLVHEERTMRFILCNTTTNAALESTAQLGAQVLRRGEWLNWSKLAADTCWVILLSNEHVPAQTSSSTSVF